MAKMASFTFRVTQPFHELPIAATVTIWAEASGGLSWEATLLGFSESRVEGRGRLAAGEPLQSAGKRMLRERLSERGQVDGEPS